MHLCTTCIPLVTKCGSNSSKSSCRDLTDYIIRQPGTNAIMKPPLLHPSRNHGSVLIKIESTSDRSHLENLFDGGGLDEWAGDALLHCKDHAERSAHAHRRGTQLNTKRTKFSVIFCNPPRPHRVSFLMVLKLDYGPWMDRSGGQLHPNFRYECSSVSRHIFTDLNNTLP